MQFCATKNDNDFREKDLNKSYMINDYNKDIKF